MGKVLKVREVGEPILEKVCEKVNVESIDTEILDIIEDSAESLTGAMYILYYSQLYLL